MRFESSFPGQVTVDQLDSVLIVNRRFSFEGEGIVSLSGFHAGSAGGMQVGGRDLVRQRVDPDIVERLSASEHAVNGVHDLAHGGWGVITRRGEKGHYPLAGRALN
jgi:hypothetical protein